MLTEQSTSTKKPTYKIIVDKVSLPITGTVTDVSQNCCQRELCYEFDNIEKIEIHFTNKNPQDTKVVDKKIVEDLLLIIDKISIDEIDLLSNLASMSVYKDSAGNIHKTHNYITFNGCMIIKIHKNLLYNKWLVNHC